MDATISPPPTSTPPPLLPPPPVILPPGISSRPRKSRGWMVVALILFVLLAFSLLGNFSQMVKHFTSLTPGHANGAGPRLEEVLLEDNDARDKIAVVPVEGIITSTPVDGTGFNLAEVVKEQLQRAEDDKHVVAVVLRVDSPGGEVLASDEIANEIRSFQDSSGKPVIVSMGNLAASGGYYVSAPGRYIVANELTITGSIGVIMSGLNYRGLMDKVGLRPQVYKSGKFKDMLSGSRNPDDVTEEERAMVQNLINEVYGKFTNVVAEGRSAAHEANDKDGKALVDNWDAYADGRVLSGSEAFKLGFVDQLGNFDDAVDKALEIAGVPRANVVEYRQLVNFSDLFRMFGTTESKAVKIDLGIELPKLKAGLPYFLSSSYVN